MPTFTRASIGAALLAAGATAFAAGGFTLSSPTIKPGSTLTKAQVFNGFGCTGDNISPELAGAGAPVGTKSFAVTVYDPDAPHRVRLGGTGSSSILQPGDSTGLVEGAGSAGMANCRPARCRAAPTSAAGFGGASPAAGRQAAPLHLHRLRAQGRQARRTGRRHGGADRLHAQRQQAMATATFTAYGIRPEAPPRWVRKSPSARRAAPRASTGEDTPMSNLEPAPYMARVGGPRALLVHGGGLDRR